MVESDYQVNCALALCFRFITIDQISDQQTANDIKQSKTCTRFLQSILNLKISSST